MALSILNPWPLTADQNGRLPMFYMANGSVHVRLSDSSGNLQCDSPSILAECRPPTLFLRTASRALQRQHLSFWIRHAGIRAHSAPFPRVQVFRLERAVKRE